MKNPRYANEQGGILIEQGNGQDLYIDSGPLYDKVIGGSLGPISEYIAPPPQPEPVPSVVSRFQARAALYQSNILATVEAAIQSADALSQMAWADAQEFRRNSQLVLSIGSQIGLTDSELDSLFIQAAAIEV